MTKTCAKISLMCCLSRWHVGGEGVIFSLESWLFLCQLLVCSVSDVRCLGVAILSGTENVDMTWWWLSALEVINLALFSTMDMLVFACTDTAY